MGLISLANFLYNYFQKMMAEYVLHSLIYIISPYLLICKLKLIHEGAILYLLMAPFLRGGVAGSKDAPPLTQCRGEIIGNLD